MALAVHSDALTSFLARFQKALDMSLARANEHRMSRGRAALSERGFIEEFGGDALYRQFTRARQRTRVTPSLFKRLRQQVFAKLLDTETISEIDRLYSCCYLPTIKSIKSIDFTLDHADQIVEHALAGIPVVSLSRDLEDLRTVLDAATSGAAKRNHYSDACRNAISLLVVLSQRRGDFGLHEDRAFCDTLAMVSFNGVAAALIQNDLEAANAIIVLLDASCNLPSSHIFRDNFSDPRMSADITFSTLSLSIDSHRLNSKFYMERSSDRAIQPLDIIQGVVSGHVLLAQSVKADTRILALHGHAMSRCRDILVGRLVTRGSLPRWVTQLSPGDYYKKVIMAGPTFELLNSKEDASSRSWMSSLLIAAAASAVTTLQLSHNDQSAFTPEMSSSIARKLICQALQALLEERNTCHAAWSDWYSVCARYMELADYGVGTMRALDRVKELQLAIGSNATPIDTPSEALERVFDMKSPIGVDDKPLVRFLQDEPPSILAARQGGFANYNDF